VIRSKWLACAIVFLAGSPALLAQHRGGRGATGGRPTTGTSDTDDLKEFKRVVALQATPEQVIQFQQLAKRTAVARKSVQDLRQLADSAGQLDVLHGANPLTTAVAEAQTDSERFLQSFSALQKSGLKNELKRLGKANSQLTKQSRALTQSLERSRIDVKQIAGAGERLDKVLDDFQTRQRAIGKEMGIQDEATAQ
jgi:hypothetical protein